MVKIDILNMIPEDRKAHSLSVAAIACDLAGHYDVSKEKAELAGLLHDIAKDQTIEMLIEQGVHVSDFLRKMNNYYPPLFHAFVAPVYIEFAFKIKDKEILNAIKWHTTGKPKMSRFEQIIYLADYLDPLRKLKGIEKLKKLAYKSLDKASYAVAVSSIRHLLRLGRRIHPLTIWSYNYYLGKVTLEEVSYLEKIIETR
ncbi:bis(5'-nucleosyl)-tetraphosphatase (symmetrical) YqeK [Candidatus Margulisiibacteriota bacterium]